MRVGGRSAGPRARLGRLAAAALLAAVALLAGPVATACARTPGRLPPPQVPGGNPSLGAEHIEAYGCGGCHVIPGIAGANGVVGPPLTDFGRRHFIAGQLPNNGENLVRWIMDPQEVEPGTAMPDLGVTEEQARDIAAYLLGLR